MIVRIAWRSLWRNRRRTLITMASIGFGLFMFIISSAFGEGAWSQMIDQVARIQSGHVTFQHPDYAEAPAVDLYMEGLAGIRRELESWPEVEMTKMIVMGRGIIRSGAGNTPGAIMGVEPSVENKTSPLVNNIVEGARLEDGDDRLVMIGVEMAERLNLKVGKKLVIRTNDVNGDMVEELARVKGIFKTGATEMDTSIVIVPIRFAWKLFQIPEKGAIQLGVILKSADDIKPVLRRAAGIVKDRPIAILPWEDVIPDVASFIKMKRGSNQIFMLLLIALVLFTIFNTIMMSVLEREREFAVLLAIGTKPSQIRSQLLMESVFLALLGCGAGIALGGAAAYLGQVHGIDLSNLMVEGTQVSGVAVSTHLYAKLSVGILLRPALIVFVATVLLSFPPMWRAAKVSIVDMLR